MKYLRSGSGWSMSRLCMGLLVGSTCFALIWTVTVQRKELSVAWATVLTGVAGTLGSVWGVSKWRARNGKGGSDASV